MLDKREYYTSPIDLRQPKYPLSRFYSDHQSKSTVKFIPNLITHKPFTFVSPFDPTLEVTIGQQIFFEINKRQTIGLYFDASRAARTSHRQIYISHEYQNIHKYKVKTTVGCGTNLLVGIEAHKKLANGIIVSLYGNYIKNSEDHLLSAGVGLKHNNIEIVGRLRSAAEPLISATYGIREFDNHFKLSLYGEVGLTENPAYGLNGVPLRQAQLQLAFPMNDYRATLTANLIKMNSLKVGFDKKTHYGRVGLAAEYFSTGQTVLYLGVNKKNFKLSLPILIIESAIPAALFGLAYVIGAYYLKRRQLNKQKKKTAQDRINQLRLIEDRANQNFQKERNKDGLLIIEAFYGDDQQISRIVGGGPHIQLLNEMSKVVDVTVPLRFFVQHSSLKIKANNRETVYGFYQSDPNAINKTLVVYQPKGQPGVVRRATFKDTEAIIL